MSHEKKKNNTQKIVNDMKKNIEISALQKAKNVLNNEVSSHIKKKMQENEEEYVYSKYKPKVYSRRKENLGLKDLNNIPHEVTVKGNVISLIISNETKFNSKNIPSGFTETELAVFVNNGLGDDESLPPYKQERPFLDETQKDMEWIDVFKNGIKNK